MPAPTNPTAATVVVLEDCTSAVVMTPVAAPLAGLWVKRASVRASEPPASARSPSVRTIMPSRKSPNPPSTLAIS
jgi:hypothetical protein